ncbi:LOW QUALITY PROTEIN: testis-expressed basic protein 1 [Rhinolophus sinicus]|uniref:LOW QUALITY PROTEIN: testis-expressed basic protein 1 n=1 Tax=Rhinolophus sinicus TaxID=89399 RepID=UPI003D7AC6A1
MFTALRTGETVPEQQTHTAANPSDKGGDKEDSDIHIQQTVVNKFDTVIDKKSIQKFVYEKLRILYFFLNPLDTSYDDRGKTQVISNLSVLREKEKRKKPVTGGKVEINRKYLISEPCAFVVCSVIFPGYTDGELAKKPVPKGPVLKSGGATRSKGSGEDKQALKKEILFTGSDESLTSMRKTESKSKAKGVALEKGKTRTEVGEKESDTGILKTQEAQVRKSEAGIQQGQEAQVRKSEAGIPQGQEAQVRKSEAGIQQGQEAQVRKSEAGIQQGQEAQVRKSEAGIQQGQEAQVKKESFEDEGKQDEEKGDAEKNKGTKQNDTKNKKGGEGQDKVKGKKEPEAKGEKESSKRAEASKGRKYNKRWKSEGK